MKKLNLRAEEGWLLLIFLFILSGRCLGQTYDGFGYSVSGTNITITNYTGPGGGSHDTLVDTRG